MKTTLAKTLLLVTTFLPFAANAETLPAADTPAAPAAAATAVAEPVTPAPIPASQLPLTEPVMRLDKEGTPLKFVMDRHDAFLKRGKENPIGILFLGDSITQNWSYGAQGEIWKKHYAPHNAANFGLGGDGTQGVLWRIANGELDNLVTPPKIIILLIGINNGSRPGVADGIKKIVAQIREKLPQSKVLLLGIFPTMNKEGLIPHRLRDYDAAVNKEIATLDDGKTIRYLDIGQKFLDTEGKISKELMPDGLHPAAPGYQIWADAMQPLLDEMLSPPSPEN
ncbi:MAG: GDSL-type esterase/lipase family protein [Opitutaceae bacterium]|jgi:lysophospholipase L1-like esterase|nr:GDSL-type esterase/lipase family protein [Opitutaceae bacterium]